MPSPVPTPDRAIARRGLAYGLGAYILWGILPVYFKALGGVASIDIVAHRVLWSVPFLALLVAIVGGWTQVRQALARPRLVALLALSALLIAVNWLLYVYAVISGHILAGSLGYYLNPLMNVLLGRIVLSEKLGPLQWLAVALAALGVAALAAGAMDHLWISLSLAVSFATYGLIRKLAPVDAVAGLSIETSLLFPFALAWLWLGLGAELGGGTMGFGDDWTVSILLAAAGVVSTIPLLLFTGAARRLRYSTLGMLQFIAPTLQFLIAVFVYGERFTTVHAFAFGAIWGALLLYVIALARDARPAPAPAAQPGLPASAGRARAAP